MWSVGRVWVSGKVKVHSWDGLREEAPAESLCVGHCWGGEDPSWSCGVGSGELMVPLQSPHQAVMLSIRNLQILSVYSFLGGSLLRVEEGLCSSTYTWPFSYRKTKSLCDSKKKSIVTRTLVGKGLCTQIQLRLVLTWNSIYIKFTINASKQKRLKVQRKQIQRTTSSDLYHVLNFVYQLSQWACEFNQRLIHKNTYHVSLALSVHQDFCLYP